MLRTKDFEGTIEFYTRRLGFTCEGRSDVDGWASLRCDAVWLIIATPNAHRPFDTPAFTGSLYFDVEDAGTLWATIKDHVRVVTDGIEVSPDDQIIAARRGAYLVSLAQRTGGWQRRGAGAAGEPNSAPEPALAARVSPSVRT